MTARVATSAAPTSTPVPAAAAGGRLALINRFSGLTPLSQPEFPVLSDQMAPKAVVRLLFHEFEAGRLVDASGRDEDIVGPEHDLAITRRSGEPHALIDESLPD